MYQAGSVYIYEKDLISNWNEIQKIVASDRAIDDEFGHAVDISGNYIIVGALNEDVNGLNTIDYAGAAYIFERDTTTGVWHEVQKVVASDRAFGD